MLNSAASSSRVSLGRDGDICIDAGALSVWRRRSLTWQDRELELALENFAFIADVTTLAPDCRFVGDSEILVARYDGLPFTAIASHTHNRIDNLHCVSQRIRMLTRRLVTPDEAFYCLVGERQRSLVESAFRVIESHEEWQMFFRGDVSTLVPTGAFPLASQDLREMAALSQREGMIAFKQRPLSQGPWYGVRHQGTLVAQGGTHLMLKRAAEIGNIVTDRTQRRRGYASRVVAALVRDLHARDRAVFLQVFKDNEAAIACYERMGFEKLRGMYLMKCRLDVSS